MQKRDALRCWRKILVWLKIYKCVIWRKLRIYKKYVSQQRHSEQIRKKHEMKEMKKLRRGEQNI